MVMVQTNKSQEDANIADVAAAEDAANAEMAAKAREDETASDVASLEESTPESTDEWTDLHDSFEDEDETAATLDDKPIEEVTPIVEAPVEDEVVAEVTPELTPEVTPDTDTPPTEDVLIPEIPAEEVEKRTPEQVSEEMSKARNDARDQLVTSFQLTEEQVDNFRDDPNTVLPQMAADLYLDIYNSVMNSVTQSMPFMMTNVMNHQDAIKSTKQQFFNSWPQLAKPEYAQTIERISESYRVMYPQADPATAVKEIGAQAWVALKLPIEGLLAATQDNTSAVPEAPMTPQGRMPASAGNAPVAARAPTPARLNDFENLADEFINDDENF